MHVTNVALTTTTKATLHTAQSFERNSTAALRLYNIQNIYTYTTSLLDKDKNIILITEALISLSHSTQLIHIHSNALDG